MLHAFLDYLSHDRQYAALTIKAYETDLQQAAAYFSEEFSLELFEATTLARLKPRHIRAWIAQLTQKEIKPRSIRRKLSSLKSYIRYVQKLGHLTHNPAAHISMPKLAQKIPAFLKESETEHLLDGIRFPETLVGYRDRLILELLYGCGLRRSELLRLKKADIDPLAQTLKVLGKGNKERLIPFGKPVSAALETYLIAVEQAGFSADNPLIIRKNGQAAYPELIYRVTRKYIGEVSTLQQRSPHVLRHSFATHMLDRGADLNAIKDLLGHQSLAATQVYTHQTLAKLKAVHQQAHPRAEDEE